MSRLHEPGHPVLATSQASFAQATEDEWGALDAQAVVFERSYLQVQRLWPRPLATAAHAGKAKLGSVRLDECVLHADCLAKYAAAFF